MKRHLAHADLIRELAHAREAQQKLFAAIIRHVQRREATGPASCVMEQIRRDNKLCRLLVDYEGQSEIVGMIDFVHEFKVEPALRGRAPGALGSKR